MEELKEDNGKELYTALNDLVSAVTFRKPPINLGGTEEFPNMCFDVAIPVEFIDLSKIALKNYRNRIKTNGKE